MINSLSLTKNNTYIVIRNVDNRTVYNNLYNGSIIQYYDMPYTNIVFKSYGMVNTTVLKALEDSTIVTKKSNNYEEVFIELS